MLTTLPCNLCRTSRVNEIAILIYMQQLIPASFATAPDTIPAPRRLHAGLLLTIFLGIATYGSFVPFKYVPKSYAAAWEQFQHVPFLQLGVDSRADWVANLLLFMPLGFLGLGIVRMDARRSLLWSGISFTLVVALGCVASITLEFCQVWFPNRTVSQNDIFAETTGAAVGAAIWLCFGERWLNQTRMWMIQLDPGHRLDTVLLLVMVAHVISSALPLDLTIHPRELWHKFRGGGVIYTPFQSLRNMQREDVLEMGALAGKCALVGWLAARVYYRRKQRGIGFGYLFLQGFAFNLLVEFMQIFVISRSCDINDIAVGTMGFIGGGWFLPVHLRRPIDTTTWAQQLGRFLLWTSYLICLLAFFWYPFKFNFAAAEMQERWIGFFRVPFATLHAGAYFQALNEILRKTTMFAILVFLTGLVARFDATISTSRRLKLLMIFFFCVLEQAHVSADY